MLNLASMLRTNSASIFLQLIVQLREGLLALQPDLAEVHAYFQQLPDTVGYLAMTSDLQHAVIIDEVVIRYPTAGRRSLDC